MNKFHIYCFASEYNSLLDKLPKNIIPLGLGNKNFPGHWLQEKNGENIIELNKYYAELTGIYWVYKNKINDYENNDWIGFCHYRRLWLDNFYNKNHNIKSNIYSKLLFKKTNKFDKHNSILLQKTKLNRETILEHFINNHGEKLIFETFKILDKSISFEFQNYLNNRDLSICNMFITKPNILKNYAEFLYPFMKKILNFCLENNLCVDKNIKLPAYFIERFTSFWFHKYSNPTYLSYVELNKFYMSNFLNKYFNTLKIPGSFSNFPTNLDI